MSSEDLNFEDFNTDNLSLAAAIAARTSQETELQASIYATLSGNPEEQIPPEMASHARIGMTALYLMRIENPDRQITGDEIAEQMIDSKNMGMLAEMLEKDSRELVVVDADKVRKLMVLAAKTGGGGTPNGRSPLRDGFATELEAAKAFAQEHGVTASAVYAQDELYYRMIAGAQSPSEYADVTMIEVVENENMDIEKVLGDLAKNASEVADMPGPDIGEAFKALEDNPVMQSIVEMQIRAVMDVVTESVRQTFLYGLIKRYGYDAINELSEPQRDALLPKAEKLHELVAETIRAEAA